MLPSDNQKERIVLRESIRARTSVTPVSILVTFVSIYMYIPFMLGLGVTQGRIFLWAAPISLLMLGRGFLSRWINKRLDEYSSRELARADGMLRVSSVLNQMTVGMGIWIVQSPSANSLILSVFMTLIVAIWSIGLLSNLFSDFRSFIMSMPFLIGETSIFWILQGGIGVSIGLSLLFAALLMVFLVRRGTEIFRDSVLMRFEKDRLLEEVEVARQNILQALQKAQAANESKAYFMAAASHDIKQPLHALAILTDTMLMSDLPESTVQLLQKQRESIGFMSAHFDALMDIGRFELGHFELRLARVRLGELSVRIDAEIAPLCAHKTLRWNLDMDDVLVTTNAELLLHCIGEQVSEQPQ
jgi:signal transduction histidine kinase